MGAIVGFIVLLVAVVLVVPSWLIPREGLTNEQLLKARNDLRSTLLQAVAGLAVGSGAYVAWRKLKDEREANLKHHVLEHEGQITERLTRAIDQLGSEKLQVRIGGIFALERIARDSARDQGAIVEVLTAFVRESAPLRLDHDAPIQGDPEARPAADVQAALTVLARRRPNNDPPGLELHLYDSWLANVYLFEAHLERAWLHRTCLAWSGLARARLSGARLISSRLEGANLRDAQLRKADLRGARLHRADLTGADLEEAELTDETLAGAKLGRANLKGIRVANARWPRAWLVGASLDGAEIYEGDLSGAFLMSASLVRAKLGAVHLDDAHMRPATEVEWHETGGTGRPPRTILRGVDLSASTLRRANLRYADLKEAILDRTDLEGARLGGADLRGVDLSMARSLTEAQIMGRGKWFGPPTIVDESTKLPTFPAGEEAPR